MRVIIALDRVMRESLASHLRVERARVLTCGWTALYILAHHLCHAPGLNTLIPRPTHHLASKQTHMPSHANHTLHHILLPPSLKPYNFTPCISTWPACSNAHNILLTDYCHSPHISQGYTSPTRHCTNL